MKKLLHLFVFAFLQINFISVKAQPYHPLPDSNAVWIIQQDDGFGGFFYNKYSTPINKNDTIINAQLYVKTYDYTGFPNLDYLGAYRSDSAGKTFYIPKDSLQEYLLFDFSKNTGDSIYNILYCDFPPYFSQIDFYVDSVDNILIGPYLLKRMYLSNNIFFPPTQYISPLIWIEKVGCAGGGFFNNIPTGLGGKWLNCMSYNDTTYYKQFYVFPDTANFYVYGNCDTTVGVDEYSQIKPSFNISPNPFSDYITIKNTDGTNSYNLKIFNSIGQLIYQKKDVEINPETSTIKLQNLNTGLYFLIISDKSKIIHTQKLVKE